MNVPVNHHYVPVMLLKRFCCSDGTLYWNHRDWEPSKIKVSIPERILFECHLYSTAGGDGARDVTLEHQFAELEGKATPVLDSLISSALARKFPILTPDDRDTLNRFFLQQYRRVPEFLAPHKENKELKKELDHYDELIVEASKKCPDMNVSSFIGNTAQKRLVQHAIVKTLSNENTESLRAIARMGLALLVTKKATKAFIIGSRPALKFNEPGRASLDCSEVELWLPISSEVALCFNHQVDGGIFEATDGTIRWLNKAIARESRIIAGRSRALISSLRNYR